MAKRLTIEAYKKGLLAGDRIILSRAITLVESDLPEDRLLADELISQILDKTGNSIRIGITGVPGVGKSTFIETFGNLIINQGHKLAVLTVDPSSQKTKGSILGDKTRMESLSTNKEAYIRPSPSGSALGGVANKTRETILLCEAAGFDVVIVETVGVGQSETTVKHMTDFFLLMMLSGAGDELQGIKKGIMEMADHVIINKADGDNVNSAKRAKIEYQNALHLFQPNYNFWTTPVSTCSALSNIGLDEIWKSIEEFIAQSKNHDNFLENRKQQNLSWFEHIITDSILNLVHNNPSLPVDVELIKKDILANKTTPSAAAKKVINSIIK